ncbi:MAG: conjugative transfer relaxase/helicase TraI [Legionella sp.]|jgi:conjugative transfer relaxase protein TraI
MLSIQPLNSAEGAASYYHDVVNYYANDSKSVRWLGEGAKVLGIHGQPVEKEQMLALLKGNLPDGTQLGRIDKDGIHHRPGFDMTLSAPKSFSILLETGADPRLAQVLDDTVDWFVGEMEKEFAQTRKTIDGKIEYIDTDNFVVSAFRQPNSRANDPQSHVHLVVQNMTYSDGKWRSLASDMEGKKGVVEQIMKHHIYGGLKFRNKLANATKEIGYKLQSDGEGLWEISGVPNNVLTHFSKRREAIEAVLDEKGWAGAKASSIAAQKTKIDKEILDVDQWRETITNESKEMGFNPHDFVASIGKAEQFSLHQLKELTLDCFYGKEPRQMNKAKDAVYVAIESVSQQQAVFNMKDLKKEALKFSIASSHSIDEGLINKAIEEQIKEQNLYHAVHPYTQKSLLTTPWQLTLETETVARIEEGKKAIEHICTTQNVRDFIKNKEDEMQFTLSSSQKKAMMSFLTSKDRFIAIQGYAGTGKTTMLNLTQELAISHGYTIRGITAGSSAANELSIKGGINATTFARELGRLQNEKQDLSKTIFVVDEASMLSNPQGHKIIKLVEQFNTQLKIIGDKAQLPSPSSGNFFSVIQDYGIHTVQMTDNLRQKDAKLKEAALHAGYGEIYDAVEKLSQIHTAPSYQERIEKLTEHWVSLTPDQRENTLCFAPTHKNRNDITLLMRESLRKEGALLGTEHQHSVLKERNMTAIKLRNAIYYTEHDVLRFNTNNPQYHIKAGDYLTIGSMSEDHKRKNALPLIRSDGSSLTFKLSSLPKFKTSNKDLERPIEVYSKHQLGLAEGDRIQWKRNSEPYGIRNSELGTIKAITSESIEISNDNDTSILLSRDAKELKHLDHGYVLTTYASQGKDKKYGLGLIESYNRFSTTIQNFYVEITRAIESMTVVTDDKDLLVKGITLNNSEKYSALEMTSATQLKAHQERFGQEKNQVNLYEVIEKKLTKEEEWNKLNQTIESYNQSKQKNHTPSSAKLAYSIVQDSKLYWLAREKLAFKSTTYRNDALRYTTSKLFHSLNKEEQQHLETVKQYASLDYKVEKSLEQVKGKELSKQTLEEQSVYKLILSRNKLAAKINNQLESYMPFLKHFSIGTLNRIGLLQHEYREGEKKAQVSLERLIQQGLNGGKGFIVEEIQQKLEKTLNNTCSQNKPNIKKEIESSDLRIKNSIRYVKDLWENGVSIKDTIAEKYLREHCGIKNIKHIHAKFLTTDKAIIFAARNAKGKLTGIQGIYLDPNTGKIDPSLPDPKFTKGIVNGSATLIQRGMRGSDLYISPSPEVAATIANNDPKAIIYTVFKPSDLMNQIEVYKKYAPKEVILASIEMPKRQLEKAINQFQKINIPSKAILQDDLSAQMQLVKPVYANNNFPLSFIHANLNTSKPLAITNKNTEFVAKTPTQLIPKKELEIEL